MGQAACHLMSAANKQISEYLVYRRQSGQSLVSAIAFCFVIWTVIIWGCLVLLMEVRHLESVNCRKGLYVSDNVKQILIHVLEIMISS